MLLRCAGFLLGLGVLVRLQYAPFVAVLALTTLRHDMRGWWQLVLGVLAAGALGAASDLAMAQAPFGWVTQNFSYNISAGRAARFGTSGPWSYGQDLLVHLGPAAVLIIAGASLVPRRYRPLVWALATNLAFHSLFAHKEYRFIWLSTFVIVVLATISSASLLEKLVAHRWHRETGPPRPYTNLPAMVGAFCCGRAQLWRRSRDARRCTNPPYRFTWRLRLEWKRRRTPVRSLGRRQCSGLF